jgi:DNA-binding transcriptional LysR family regulator
MPKPNSQATVSPRVSLEQWRSLVGVVDAGGYAQAAQVLHRSQSSVTYAVQKLEAVLNVKAFEIQGRKAILTTTGQTLYRRARALLEDAGSLERAARKATAGWEAEISLAVEVLFPMWLLLECMQRFGEESPETRIELFETVIGGTTEAIESGAVDLAISPVIPRGFAGEPLLPMRFVPVAHPEHALHRLGHELAMRDLRKHRHLVVRDSGSRRDKRAATIDVEQRWTVTNMTTSIAAACRGYGFSWFPEDKIRTELADGVLKILPLRDGRLRTAECYLIFADRDATGPGAARLAEIIKEEVGRTGRECGAVPDSVLAGGQRRLGGLGPRGR